MKLWLIPFNNKYKYISSFEERISEGLSCKRSDSYRFTRGYLRYCLSKVLCLPCKDIPISALPGKPPTLPNKFGYVSISHYSNEALLIGWSPKKIGVDIEHINRNLNLESILKNKWFKNEEKLISNLNKNDFKIHLLKIWVIKEALIKSHFGSIFKDYDDWIIKNEGKAYNYKLKISRKIFHKRLNNWNIGIAFDGDIKYEPELIELT